MSCWKWNLITNFAAWSDYRPTCFRALEWLQLPVRIDENLLTMLYKVCKCFQCIPEGYTLTLTHAIWSKPRQSLAANPVSSYYGWAMIVHTGSRLALLLNLVVSSESNCVWLEGSSAELPRCLFVAVMQLCLVPIWRIFELHRHKSLVLD